MLKIVTYGVMGKRKPPPGIAHRFDCRSLRNPHSQRDLRDLDGRDVRVQAFVLGDPDAPELLRKASTAAHADPNGTIAFFCHGGFHRSVAMAEILATTLRVDGVSVQVEHLAIGPR